MTQSSCKRETKSKRHPGMKLAPVRVFSCKRPLREYKTVLDSGFHTADSRFQVLDSSLCRSGTWILDSRFQSFVGFRIP